jgi:glycosyltransferase involved in cell wall biosynthesis
MKILIVSQYFWPEYFKINELAECLNDMGHEIEVLTGIPNYPQGKFYDGYGILKNIKQNLNGIKIHRVPIIPRGAKGGDKRLIPNYISYVITASCAVLAKVFNKYDAILVYEVSPITQAYPALLLRLLSKTPVCLYVYDLWPETLFSHGIGKDSALKKFMYFIVHSIYKRCDRIFISSKGFEKSILSSGYDIKRLHYIPNWAEDFYVPLKPKNCIREKLKLSQETFIVMYAGNIGYAQSFETVLEAAKILRDNKEIHFVILGDGSLKQWAIDEVNNHKLSNISFLGKKPAEEMPEYFAQANAMLVTLKKRENYALTLPGRVQSYMACGKPILASAGNEVSRILRESMAGFYCDPEDAKGLALIIERMKKMSNEEYFRMSENAIIYSKKEFNKDKLLNQIEYLFNEMSKQRSRKKVF